MNNNELSGPIAALILPVLNKPLLMFAKSVHDALSGNPHFPNPNPTLVLFAGNIAAYDDAEVKAAGRGKGAAALRNAKRKKVKADLHHLRDYVQSVVEAEANPADAAAMIESAFMSVRKSSARSRPELRAKNTGLSCVVALEAKALAPHAVYYWEYSLDQKSWTIVPETMKASTVISGLCLAQKYYFRFRALTRQGPRDYSQVVSLLVV